METIVRGNEPKRSIMVSTSRSDVVVTVQITNEPARSVYMSPESAKVLAAALVESAKKASR